MLFRSQANGVTGSQAEVASGDLVRTVPKRRETRSPHAMLASGKIPQHAVATGPNQGDAVADDSQSEDYADYLALMLCDPLSCASDTQVVRMELPGSATAASQGAQPQMADMIVGYDGVVRAIRFVN